MSLDRIRLADFRNHVATRLEGTARFNLLIGPNGAGKTNVLEALSLLAPGRGLRRAQLGDMAREGAHGGFAIGADLISGISPVRIGTAVRPDAPGRRQVQASGAPLPAARLAEWLSMSWLTPAMDRLFADSASARRRFLDRMVLGIDPGHAANSAIYDKALRERNRLMGADERPDPRWLDALEREMADAGAKIAKARAETVAALDAHIAALPDAPFARPKLAVDPAAPADAEALAEIWRKGRGADRGAGRTLVGPHRDDLAVVMAGSGRAAAECSTGEQKAMLIAITLAHAALSAGARPLVLLLDEVAAHLDPDRRAVLYERLAASGAQVWMTGTETEPFASLPERPAVWHLSGGAAERLP
ncbi:DNA replication/repair protein RecF [Croceicoccus naphthovorans]|uniref:DNA replication and repair protein RecF n=1 Tax=Croceicoccus naphthovorans TaxID=1348774 RepID=A0A0G3XLQ8_9SPHN|nr:DNA replication/repair protein RecF [Croceicoccus naphthovorans]AKM11554.1 recombinase RecF [Croceicoccus naphthovorans]MBB3989747.1 DNA replication and repair protein RecF [Croceicoccus naphthovorans]